MALGLAFTVCATTIDKKSGNIGIIAPIAIGFIVDANIVAGGAFDGASMNPAVSFGPAVVSWTWSNHWVYWVGPFVGGGIAALIYEIVFPTRTIFNVIFKTTIKFSCFEGEAGKRKCLLA